MEREFDLINEPWICVRTADLTIKEVSLKEALLEAHNYKELAGETKAQDFAVLRLLLALIYTVFSRYDANGEAIDLEDDPDLAINNWINIWNSKRIPAKPIEQYFLEWHDRFWLFDDKYPFYQSTAVNEGYTYFSTLKMIGSMFESNDKKRLFSERLHIQKEKIPITYSEAARWLVHLNCFGDNGYKDKNKQIPKRTWVSQLSLIAIKGENLFETLMLNYNAAHDIQNDVYESKPSWEYDNNVIKPKRLIAIPNNQAALLSLMSRRIYLARENGMVNQYCAFGGDYFEEEDVIDEQMTLWIRNEKKKKLTPRIYDTSRKAWQEFGSIAVFNNKNSDQHRSPGIMNWIDFLLRNNLLSHNYLIKINMAAVLYKEKDQTSLPVIDMVSDELTFHSQLLLKVGSGWRERINIEIEKCDKAAWAVYNLYKDLQKACGRSDKDQKTKLSGELNAKEQFYDMIDRPFRLWLADLKIDCDMDEYSAKLESSLRKIALKMGNELAAQSGDMSIFGRYIKGSSDTISSAKAMNKYVSSIINIFDKVGEEENE